jgi:hypothetical protein
MRRFGPSTSQTNLKESLSSPGPFLLEESGDSDVVLMPPPMSLPVGKKVAKRGFALIRRGSTISDMSRSDSVISVDDVRSLSNGKGEKLFDSESDTASFQGSDSVDSSAEVFSAGLATGKTASPVIYSKMLSSLDGGSQV